MCYGKGFRANGEPARDRKDSSRLSHIIVEAWQALGKAQKRKIEDELGSQRSRIRDVLKATADRQKEIASNPVASLDSSASSTGLVAKRPERRSDGGCINPGVAIGDAIDVHQSSLEQQQPNLCDMMLLNSVQETFTESAKLVDQLKSSSCEVETQGTKG